MKKILAKRLQKGDTIGVIAPSNPILEKDLAEINNSIILLEEAGYRIKFGKYAFLNTTGYGATVKEKAEDLNSMFKDKEVQMIWCARGGNNSNSLFEYIDYDAIKQNPKIICGFSDTTSILNIITEKTGLVTFHGPTFKWITSSDTDYSYRQVLKRLEQGSLELGDSNDKYICIKQGIAEGELIGSNLSLTKSLVCGKYNIDFTDKILFIEDLGYGSGPAAISNYIYYMKQNGVFDKIRGIWLGNYEHESKISIERILLDAIGDEYDFPIIKSNNFGHIDTNTTIPIGTKARIKEGKIELLENCVKQ